jgi:hypothetical protein
MKCLVVLVGLTLLAPAVCVRADDEGRTLLTGEVTMIARGTFEVKVTPQPKGDEAGGPFDRLLLDKQFQGDLAAASKGQMLAAATAVEGSAGYVAFELVTGALNGKRGSFILQHKGTMRKGVYAMSVTVVPDSGTDELAGIAGTMTIIIDGRRHDYEFEYTVHTSPQN